MGEQPEANLKAPLEELGPERFQRFCQSLISYEKPNIQAFEVGSPDGGRDALNLSGWDDELEYEVLQVKFVRRPNPLEDPEEWVDEIVKGEMPKIERLIKRGASSYCLMTNVVGTPHLDGGSVDKVSSYLGEKLPIPAVCWWRNDLLTRLAKHHELRWGYPELLNAADILKELVEGSLSEHRQRRTNAIRSFLAKQHKTERKVRFKQVELQNDLLSLFVDVPATLGPAQEYHHRDAGQLIEGLAWKEGEPFPHKSVGAARLLLHPDAEKTMSKVVIEGAPGQGKSTLGQYVSQVHRMRLLKKKGELAKVAKEHRRGPARLPFKIDLRDFAVFLREEDPFKSEPGWGGLPVGWPRSLEGFLAASVRLSSGGAEFDVSDLQATAEVSYLLLVLDGLDEVAEVKDRKRVVDAVLDGCTRLEEMALGLQAVVTTRPVAFTNVPTLVDESFLYLGLDTLTRKLASEYCSKWTAARGLDGADTTGVKQALMAQLDKPHISDLSRNPMQLAILLALISTKGQALPEKRTALYTSYMNVFFNREAAKDSTVREHREILLALHRQLGWQLHARAEKSSSGGTISEKELKLEVERFLEREDKDLTLVDKLFHGVVDRIFALVSPRLGGQFEFEIQPLREYFAADYLYKTAQVSRVGDERSGTRPERFESLARNSFWLNVTRFYAGFYDIGELPSLVDQLEDLADDDVFAPTDRAWSLAATFLTDWSFALARRSRKGAIELTLADLGRRHFLRQRDETLAWRSEPPLILPKGSGLDELGERCWTLLESEIPADREKQVLRLLNELPEEETLAQIRQRLAESKGAARTRWLRVASQLSATQAIEDDEITAIADEDGEDLGARAVALLEGHFEHLVELDEAKSSAVVEGLIDGTLTFAGPTDRLTSLGLLGALFSTNFDLFRLVRKPGPLSAGDERRCPTAKFIDRAISPFFDSDRPAYLRVAWDDVIEELRRRWGDGWGLTRFALKLTGEAGRPDSGGGLVGLTDPSEPLLRRLQHGIWRGGTKSGDWWLEQLEAASEEEARKIVAVTATAWPSGRALEQALPALEQRVKAFKGETLAELCAMVGTLSIYRGPAQSSKLGIELVKSLPMPMILMLINRDPKLGKTMFDERLRKYDGDSEAIQRYCLETAAGRVLKGAQDEALLTIVRRGYKALGDFPYDQTNVLRSHYDDDPSPELAPRIVAEAEAYPQRLVDAAEARCSGEARKSVPPLLDVAKRENWFAE